MEKLVRTIGNRPAIVFGGVVLLGVLEFVALQRSQRRG